jgi:two-component system cell cycle sensor histidine kinase/response regulator CckA
VTRHGGSINVYSEVGKGSPFKVYIPAFAQGMADRGEKVQIELPMGKGELILVVDDEATIRGITRQILECYGYGVVTAGDGTEALVQYIQKKGDIRVMITDMMMPFMDGAATIRAIRKIDPKAKIIATSGLLSNGYAKETRGLGVNAFLAKPHTAEVLLQTLREVLGKPSNRTS